MLFFAFVTNRFSVIFFPLAIIYLFIVIFGLITAIYLVITYKKYRDGSIPSGDELTMLTCPACNAPLDSKPHYKCQYCGFVVRSKKKLKGF